MEKSKRVKSPPKSESVGEFLTGGSGRAEKGKKTRIRSPPTPVIEEVKETKSKSEETESEGEKTEGEEESEEAIIARAKAKAEEKTRAKLAAKAKAEAEAAMEAEEVKPEREPEERGYVCYILKSTYRIPFLLFMSYFSGRQYDEKKKTGRLMVITDEEAINFHTSVDNQQKTCKPFEVVIHNKVESPTTEEERTDADYEYTKFLKELVAELRAQIQTYTGTLSPELARDIQSKCGCAISTANPEKVDYLRIKENVTTLSVTFNFVTTRNDTETLHPIMRFRTYNRDMGPKPKYTGFEGRAYGSVSYLYERAKQLSKEGREQQRYTDQLDALKRMLDRKLLSCQSIASATLTCYAQHCLTTNGEKCTTREEQARQQEKQGANVLSLVRSSTLYPKNYESVIRDAVSKNYLTLKEILDNYDALQVQLLTPSKK